MENSVKSINMIDAVKLFFKNYFNFTGRASRSEYWWFVLAYFIVAFVFGIIEAVVVGSMVYNDPYAAINILRFWYLMPSNILAFALLIGFLSLAARRLQDRGYTGWWQLATLAPTILIYIIFLALLASGGENVGLAVLMIILGLIVIGTSITMIVFLCLPPKEDENKWGRNPLLPETSLTDQIPD